MLPYVNQVFRLPYEINISLSLLAEESVKTASLSKDYTTTSGQNRHTLASQKGRFDGQVKPLSSLCFKLTIE